jgi:DNA gyrase subunit A
MVELETERDELRRDIAALEAVLDSRELLHQLVSDELGEVAARYATPRRTVLLESEAMAPSVARALAAAPGGKAGKAAPLALEIADHPCWVLLSATGRMARTSTADPLIETGGRNKHDVLTSVLKTSARSEIGALTSLGRMLRLQVVDMPVLPPTAALPNLAGGVGAKDFITLTKGESLVGFVPLNSGFAVGTAAGVVKRVTPDYPLNRDDWEYISLKPKDFVVGAGVAADDDDLVFITQGAQLLRYSAANVRPQGRTAGGMAGIKLGAGDTVLSFGVVSPADANAVVVTVAGGQEALPGTPSGSAKVTALSEYPVKGRATGGVRAHRFLKGEDKLFVSWAGHGPAKASTDSGVVRALPVEHGHRDGSGVALSAAIELVGPSLGWDAAGPGPAGASLSPTTSSATSGAAAAPAAPVSDPAPILDTTQEAFELPVD